MKIITPPDFFQTFRDTYLLLDTSAFIDAFLNPSEFGKFFNELKSHDATLLSLDSVKIEFLKGAPTAEKYNQKIDFFDQIIDACLPMAGNIVANLYKMVQVYKEEGKSLSVTDLSLGATLMQYRKGLYLLTKNTTEFPTSIFNLVSHFNVSYRKGIHVYGIFNVI